MALAKLIVNDVVEKSGPMFIIEYDLRGDDRDYGLIIGDLGKLGAVKVLKSHWWLRSQRGSAVSIFNRLFPHIDQDKDGLLVVSLDGTRYRGHGLLAEPKTV